MSGGRVGFLYISGPLLPEISPFTYVALNRANCPDAEKRQAAELDFYTEVAPYCIRCVAPYYLRYALLHTWPLMHKMP
jgi:hypothetical protein